MAKTYEGLRAVTGTEFDHLQSKPEWEKISSAHGGVKEAYSIDNTGAVQVWIGEVLKQVAQLSDAEVSVIKRSRTSYFQRLLGMLRSVNLNTSQKE